MHKDDAVTMAKVKVSSLVKPIQPCMAKVYSLKSCQTNTAMHKDLMAKVKVSSLVKPIQPCTGMMLSPWPRLKSQVLSNLQPYTRMMLPPWPRLKSQVFCQTNTAMHKDDAVTMAKVKVSSLVKPIQPCTRKMLSPWPRLKSQVLSNQYSQLLHKHDQG